MDSCCACSCFVSDDGLLGWLTFAATIVGGVFALWRWRHDVSVKRLIELQKSLSIIRQDDEMKLAIYKLDNYSVKWFNCGFPDSKEAAPIDKLLFHFCSVLYSQKEFIGINEFGALSYEIENVLLNPQVQDYLYNLQMYSKKKGLKNPFKVLISYGLDRELLDAQFFEIMGRFPKTYKKDNPFTFHKYYADWLKEEQKNAKENY